MRLIEDCQATIWDHYLPAHLTRPDPILRAIAAVLATASSELLRLVHDDLVRHLRDPNRGRPGLPANQVLRFAIILFRYGWTYREARDRLSDGLSLREFCQFGGKPVPEHSAFNRALKRLRPSTIEKINELIVQAAISLGIEDGSRLRVDTTVFEADIRHPTDSGLLWDCIRVMTRLVDRAREIDPSVGTGFPNRLRKAKKRFQHIASLYRVKPDQRVDRRVALYRELLAIAHEVLEKGVVVFHRCQGSRAIDVFGCLRAIAAEMDNLAGLMRQVIDQTERRVLRDEKVPATEKIVSIFEPHTEIIRRGKPTVAAEFGHKVLLQEGGSGIISSYEVLEGNPADCNHVEKILDRHKEIFGRAPLEFATDRGFYSDANFAVARERGIATISMPKPGSRSEEEAARESLEDFRAAQRFRAGIEGRISVLKRGRGLDLIRWSGLESFQAAVGLAIMANNLMVIARHLIARN